MFTGIVECMGSVTEIVKDKSNKTFWIESPISNLLNVNQSVSHDGVCLTVEEVKRNRHRVTAIDETLEKSNLQNWEKGRRVNLERGLQLTSLVDGHIVQGHVDAKGKCKNIENKNGSHVYTISYPSKFAKLLIEKGSIAINGTSLTVYEVKNDTFCVAIIPYTLGQTNFSYMNMGDSVNLEFDMVGKYILRNVLLADFENRV